VVEVVGVAVEIAYIYASYVHHALSASSEIHSGGR
jgi:hypothetical protein